MFQGNSLIDTFLRFNRTFMELKFDLQSMKDRVDCFNRTFMELK